MKRILCFVLVALLLLTSLVGCGKKEDAALKFGSAVYAYYGETKSADGATDGSGKVTVNAAAVLLDAEGKIVKSVIDCAEADVKFTSEGKAVAATEVKTKAEKGKDYGMVAYGNAKLEWYEQVDAFNKTIVGKTIDEVKALVVTEGEKINKGNDEVQTAGCTIYIADFVKALEKAVANAADSAATKGAELKLGFITSINGTDATEEKEGTQAVDATVSAVALKDGKVVVADTDVASASVKFDTKGASKMGEDTTITTKRALGANYGMAAYGTDLNKDGKVLEWNEQADAFDAACAGLDKDGIAALAIETGYAAEAVQTAGCTIHVGDMVKAAVKAATV